MQMVSVLRVSHYHLIDTEATVNPRWPAKRPHPKDNNIAYRILHVFKGILTQTRGLVVTKPAAECGARLSDTLHRRPA
jgi:hypothetical protein